MPEGLSGEILQLSVRSLPVDRTLDTEGVKQFAAVEEEESPGSGGRCVGGEDW